MGVVIQSKSFSQIQVANRDKKQALQVVNLGAGMDTRACRMECYREFEKGFEVDLQKGCYPESGAP